MAPPPPSKSALDTVRFESRLSRALERVRVTLEEERSYAFASQVQHRYQDKYLLAERMTLMAAASQLNCLRSLGISLEVAERMRQWSQTSPVFLRFRAEERCTYDHEESREEEAPRRHVDEVAIGGRVRAAWTSKVVNTITEHFWKYEASYEVLAVHGVGADPGDCISILSRTGRDELKTANKTPPHPSRVPSEFEVNVSWLFSHLEAGASTPAFKVDRRHKSCHTPRRNADVEAACRHFRGFMHWASFTTVWLKKILQVQPDPTRKLDVSALGDWSGSSILVPVLPLLADGSPPPPAAVPGDDDAVGSAASAASTPPQRGSDADRPAIIDAASAEDVAGLIMGGAAFSQLLAEEHRALSEKRASLGQAFPSGTMVASVAEASLVVLLQHCHDVCSQWSEVIDYIEAMLRTQLIAAIGKEVSPADFAEYMRFHSHKLFGEAYMPAPFCFAVRRSEQHAPEGTLSVEEDALGPGGDSRIPSPIMTMCSKSDKPQPMEFALNASTNISFKGDRFLHAWLSHRFSSHPASKLSLVAKTRPFSSMLLLVGRITSATTFHPKYAAILENKDELTIPLNLSTIPTPKEFKDAIESLSPEQQEFAKAFRAMQLESTLFGILIIHIKPQLEKVLNLPEGCLTKEIKLAQDLMSLFIKYQIPPDLLSFDVGTGTNDAEASASERLAAVKAHVGAMQSVIGDCKKEDIQLRQLECTAGALRSQGDMLDELKLKCESLRCVSSKLIECRPTARRREPAPPAAGAAAAAAAAPAAAAVRQSPPAAAPLQLTQAEVARQEQPRREPPRQEPQRQGPPLPAAGGAADLACDYTKVPREMDERFQELDTDGALRPTIISPGERWTKRAQKALLARPTTSNLGSQEQKKEMTAAFDLLDAITKSGATTIDHATLHVLVAATHCFDKTVTETVVQDNMNPIEKVERSMLIMASTVHQQPAAALVQGSQLARLKDRSPGLLLAE